MYKDDNDNRIALCPRPTYSSTHRLSEDVPAGHLGYSLQGGAVGGGCSGLG